MRKTKTIAGAVALLSLVSLINISCTQVKQVSTRSNAFKNLPQYWLKVSMNAGQFYDDDKQFLLDHRPFCAIDDAKTLDGYTLYPPKESHTIPAGTLVKIVDISFPNNEHIFDRPIFSPKNNILIYFKLAKERGLVSIFSDRNYILLAPKNIQDNHDLNRYLSKLLTLDDPNSWILHTESHIKKGIFFKKAIFGMSREQLLSALGPPNKKQIKRFRNGQRQQEFWHYRDRLIIFSNHKVSEIKNFF